MKRSMQCSFCLFQNIATVIVKANILDTHSDFIWCVNQSLGAIAILHACNCQTYAATTVLVWHSLTLPSKIRKGSGELHIIDFCHWN